MTERKEGAVVAFTPVLQIFCPYCGADVTVGETADGDGVGMHALPPCRGFIDNDLDVLIRDVRLAVSGETQEG